jgi:AbiJ N-terminal domain 4
VRTRDGAADGAAVLFVLRGANMYSIRYGYKEVEFLNVSNIKPQTKSGIINGLDALFLINIEKSGSRSKTPYFEYLCNFIWHHIFRELISEIPWPAKSAKTDLLNRFNGVKFPDFYDYIEAVARIEKKDFELDKKAESFANWCNKIFIRDAIPIRFISGLLVELTNENEIKEVECALNSKIPTIAEHIRNALILLADRKTPDYRNSIKESISAVEAAARKVVGSENLTLGKALGQLEKSHGLDPSLKSGFSSLYGWTSGESGIRHAMAEKDTVTEADARFMLVACSAFSNYLLASIKPSDK